MSQECFMFCSDALVGAAILAFFVGFIAGTWIERHIRRWEEGQRRLK